jgi:hypothetical protein
MVYALILLILHALLCHYNLSFLFFFIYGSTALYGPGPPRFVEVSWSHTHFRHTTVCRPPLDEGPARRRDLYLTTHNTHKRQTSMPPVGFEPTILVSEWPQTHALDRTVTGIGSSTFSYMEKCFRPSCRPQRDVHIHVAHDLCTMDKF